MTASRAIAIAMERPAIPFLTRSFHNDDEDMPGSMKVFANITTMSNFFAYAMAVPAAQAADKADREMRPALYPLR